MTASDYIVYFLAAKRITLTFNQRYHITGLALSHELIVCRPFYFPCWAALTASANRIRAMRRRVLVLGGNKSGSISGRKVGRKKQGKGEKLISTNRIVNHLGSEGRRRCGIRGSEYRSTSVDTGVYRFPPSHLSHDDNLVQDEK